VLYDRGGCFSEGFGFQVSVGGPRGRRVSMLAFFVALRGPFLPFVVACHCSPQVRRNRFADVAQTLKGCCARPRLRFRKRCLTQRRGGAEKNSNSAPLRLCVSIILPAPHSGPCNVQPFKTQPNGAKSGAERCVRGFLREGFQVSGFGFRVNTETACATRNWKPETHFRLYCSHGPKKPNTAEEF